MTATTNLHSASAARRSHELHELAEQLYAVIACGHDGLTYNVDDHRAALTELRADGQRRVVPRKDPELAELPPWQRARELVDGGVERDRRFNAWVLEQHLRGKYSVAPAAPGWVQWVALDIDAHPAADSPELVARRLARARADRVLAGVWRALQCSAERQPLIERTPRNGYHVWLPLTRGPSSANPEHTWPAGAARAWVERHLLAAGLELAPGVLEVYPSGRGLRAPCGRGKTLLQATRPGDPDALGLVPWPGTMADEQRIDWRGERAELSTPVRRVAPMVRTFLAQWETQRRTLADWLGRPEAAWDPAWGFLGWRDEEPTSEIAGEISSSEENSGGIAGGQDSRSQESDDVQDGHGAGGPRVMRVGRGRVGRSKLGSGSASSVKEVQLPPQAEDSDQPPDPAGDRLVRGRVFGEKIRRLLVAGITEVSTRHDAVLSLAFYWFATCGFPLEKVLLLLEQWCRSHPHQGSRLAARPRAFIATCVREARHYVQHHSAGWRFRGRGAAALATLAPADHVVIRAIDPQVATEVSTILAWLAGHAGGDGRVADPVQISAGLLERLCGDRRIVGENGQRRRSTTHALAELERVGVLTMASNYRVGQRGRLWSCWYRFGSGDLPSAVSVPTSTWQQIEPLTAEPMAPTLAVVPCEPSEAPSTTPVEVRVLGERLLREGLVRVLSDGVRGLARTLVVRAPSDQPTVKPSARAPWFVRAWLLRPFTPGRLWATDPAMVIAFPDIEARRRMSRRQRLAWGGGGSSAPADAIASAAPVTTLAPVIPLVTPRSNAEVSEPIAPATAAPATAPTDVFDLAPVPALQDSADAATVTSISSAGARPATSTPNAAPEIGRGGGRSEAELRAELATMVGEDAAAAAPVGLLEIMCHAWGNARGRGRGS